MNNRTEFLFTLMPQRDRRQLPDRRTNWRGSRRAADHALANASPSHSASILWTSSSDDSARGVEKQVLH